MMQFRLTWLKLLLTPVYFFFITGCASDPPEPPPEITFYVDPSPQLNNGRIAYMMIRNVKEKQFLDDGYASVAGKAFPSNDDPSLLAASTIYPGRKQMVKVKGPEKDQLAIYLMFSDPGSNWRSLLVAPLEDAYEIKLPGINGVELGPEPGCFDRMDY